MDSIFYIMRIELPSAPSLRFRALPPTFSGAGKHNPAHEPAPAHPSPATDPSDPLVFGRNCIPGQRINHDVARLAKVTEMALENLLPKRGEGRDVNSAVSTEKGSGLGTPERLAEHGVPPAFTFPFAGGVKIVGIQR